MARIDSLRHWGLSCGLWVDGVGASLLGRRRWADAVGYIGYELLAGFVRSFFCLKDMMFKAIKMLFGRLEPKKGTRTKEFAADGLPLITIDEAHNHTSADATQEYAVPPCDRLIVDASCYRFCVPEKLGVSGPDVLHLIHGAEEYYRLSWDGAGKICVEANSLEAIRGPSRFAEFSRGEKYILGVGVDGVANADHQLSFAPLWVGLVNVE